MVQKPKKAVVQYLFEPGGPREPKYYAPRRRKHFDPTPQTAEACEVVRGCLIEQSELSFAEGRLGAVLWQNDWLTEETLTFVARLRRADDEDEIAGVLREWGWKVFHALLLAQFPEEYSVNGTEPPGVCPEAGPKRAGAARVALAAAVLADPEYRRIRAEKEREYGRPMTEDEAIGNVASAFDRQRAG